MRSLLLVLGLLLLAGNLTADDLHFVTEEFPPFSYSRGSQAGGAISEVVQAVCSELGYHCSIEVHPWRRALRLAEDGLVDGIFTVIQSPARSQAFFITPMLVTSGYDFYTRRESDFIYRQPSDMRGKQIGVYGPSGTSFVLSEALKGVSAVDIQLVTDNQRLMLMLNAGRFGQNGVVVLNRDVARHLIEHNQLYGLRQAGHLSSISYGVGFSRKKVGAAQFELFNRSLAKLIKSGQVGVILQRYGLQPAH